MPQALAEDIRRRSSSIRSSVRATSKPPDSVKTPISWYCRMLSSVRSVISREWSTGKMKFDGVAGRAAGVGQRALVELDDVAPAEPGQVVHEAVADDAGADDDGAGGGRDRGHLRPPFSLRITQLSALYETDPSMRLPRRTCQPGTTGEGTEQPGGSRGALLEPGVDLAGVGGDPLLGRRVRAHALLGDVGRHQVLLGVGDLEVLDQLDRR